MSHHRDRRCAVPLRLILIAAQLAISAAVLGNELSNPGFEQSAAGKLAGWTSPGQGYALDRQTVHEGHQSLCCEAADRDHAYGAAQVIRYDRPDRRPIIFGGWSKARSVVGSGDYSVYLDVIYDDGTPLWGLVGAWSTGTHDWEYTARVCWPEKPVREIRAYVFLRQTTGKAWFDDVFVHRGGLHVVQPRISSDFPRTAFGERIRAGLTQDAEWRCTLLDAAGKELDAHAGRGSAISWDWPGRHNARPARLSIAAKTSNGERVELQVPARLPERAANPVRSGYAVWWRNAMQKVYPTEFPPSDRGQPAISLARNEREGFQLAVTSADDVRLRDVAVSVDRLVNERGDVFPSEAIEQHLVGYIYVETPSGHPQAPDRPSWCPEVLLRGRPFDVHGGRTQTVWINFHAAEGLPPGTYRGKVVVRPAGMPASELPLSVRVRGFTLPRTPRMKTSFAMMDGFTRATYGQITPELRRRCLDLMLDHRLNPDDISRTDPPAVADLLYARRQGMNAFNIVNLVPKPKGNPLWVCTAEPGDYRPEFTQELAARLDAYMQELRKHDLSKLAYFYGFDERGPEYDELIKGICKFLKQRYPEVSTFTTAGYMYDKRRQVKADYQDSMDWYCPLTPKYDRELSGRLRAQGKQVWWYVCCGPKYPYANFAAMDYPSVEGRLLAWMTFGFQSDGLLYWHVNYWPAHRIIEDADPYLDCQPDTVADMAGDGCLTYPTRDGPVGSIRLENIRDGLEDYDYLALLADRKGRPVAEAYVARLVKSMTDFSRDPAALYRVRAEIAEQLDSPQ
jgi:hypothetical protein